MSLIIDSKQKALFPFVLVFLEIITFLSMDMYLPALPSIALDFNISQDMAQYTQAAWFMGSMSMQLILGPIAESYGRKKVLVTGILVFIISSLILATTADINIFLGARLLQGTTVCAVIVAGYATIHELYQGKTAVQILAVMSSITILAPALGPVIGAIIITYSQWQYIFMLLAVCGVLGIIGVMAVMPVGKISYQSSVKKIKKGQTTNKLLIILDNYKKIFTNVRFMQIAMLYFFVVICFFIWIVESPFIIINKHNKSELFFGLVQLCIFAGYIAGAQTSKRLIGKLSAQTLSDIGLAVVSGAVLAMLFLSALNFNIYLIVLAMMGVSFGAASLSGLMNRMAIESSDRPMTSRVAAYSLVISTSASVGSIMVTLINDMTFDNIAVLMALCVSMALVIYSRMRATIELKD